MKDGFIRKTIKRVVLMMYRFDLRCTRVIQKLTSEPLYKLKGSCNQCGACCETPMISLYPPLFYLKSTRGLIVLWHRYVNGFELIGTDRRRKTLIFKCTHWNSESKLCDSYSSRPGMCRDYPCNLLHSCNPEFLPECSYYAEDNNAGKMREALEELNLPNEKLAELKKKLHVR